jgi:hypothetical protein
MRHLSIKSKPALLLLALLCPAGLLRAASATITINAASVVNGFIPSQVFGTNVDHGQYVSVYQALQPTLQSTGIDFIRYPGGSGSDLYHWNGTGNWVNNIWVPSNSSATQGFNCKPLNNGTSAAGTSLLSDGVTTTAWVSSSDTDFPNAQWAYFDLTASKAVTSVQIWWGLPYATTFQVQYWDPATGNQWGPYLDTASHWITTSTGTVTGTGGQQTVTFTSVTTRYIRILLTGSSSANGGYAVGEVEIFNGATQLSTNSATTPTQATVSSCTITSQATGAGVMDFDDYMAYCNSFSPAATPLITVNFGTGTPQEAAAWVHYANGVKGYHVKYWEIGNELMGNWEAGGPLSATDYARRFAEFYTAMIAEDPSIKLLGPISGPVDASNNYNTATFLHDFSQRLISGGVPQALGGIDLHVYASSNNDADAALLATPASWAGWATSVNADTAGLSGAGSMPVVLSEYNANSSGTNITVRLVNGLWLVNWLGKYLSAFGTRAWTTFFALVNSSADESSTSAGSFSQFEGTPGPYQDQPFASYWAVQMLSQDFAIAGDTRTHNLVSTTSNAANLVAYSDLRPDGVLSLIVSNQDSANTYNTTIGISGFSPQPSATTWSFSAAQYAWETSTVPYHVTPDNPPAQAVQTGISSSFSASFPPYSISCFQFLPQGSPTPSPTPSPVFSPTATPTASATPPAGPTPCATILCYNGETGAGNVNLAAGGSYTTAASVSEDAAAAHGGADGLDITYSFNNFWGDFSDNFADWSTARADNLTGYDTMEFWVRTPSGRLDYLFVNLSDNTNTSSLAGVNSYLPGGVNTTWQKVDIPLSAFTGVNMAQVMQFSLVIQGVQSGYIEVYADDVVFLKHCATATPSISPSASPSFTKTPSSSPSPSPSQTISPSPSSTASATSTASSTPSITPSPSSTNTATGSPSVSASPSGSATPTATDSPNPLWSPTNSPTQSLTWSASPSCSATPTESSTPSSSSSPTPSATATSTASPTSTATASPSATPSPTSTASATSTASLSASASSTASATSSSTSSSTATPSNSPTLSASPSSSSTRTATPTSTASATATGTASISPSSTASPTATATAISTFTASPTASASASSGFSIERVVPVPNPQHGKGLSLLVLVRGKADSLTVRLYSQALNEVASFKAPGGSGWVAVATSLASLPSGTFFVIVTGQGHGQTSKAKAVTMLRLP